MFFKFTQKMMVKIALNCLVAVFVRSNLKVRGVEAATPPVSMYTEKKLKRRYKLSYYPKSCNREEGVGNNRT